MQHTNLQSELFVLYAAKEENGMQDCCFSVFNYLMGAVRVW